MKTTPSANGGRMIPECGGEGQLRGDTRLRKEVTQALLRRPFSNAEMSRGVGRIIDGAATPQTLPPCEVKLRSEAYSQM